MPYEEDTPPERDTFRYFVWATVAGLGYLRAYYGRRIVGGLLGLMPDMLAEATRQSIIARMPGHPEQAPDSLTRVGLDRDLYRFRGETDANWTARVRECWDDYEQAGTGIQVLKVVNQWGNAGWPDTWPSDTVTLVESGDPADWWFELTIPFGMIDPPWTPWEWGDGSLWGEPGLFWGIGVSTDIPVLLRQVRKWKRSASRGLITIEYASGSFTTFTV